MISIHALLTESDLSCTPSCPPTAHFNPRSPHGERQSLHPHRIAARFISIHALLTESDRWRHRPGTCRSISIHALLTESDDCLRTITENTAISIHALLTESDSAQDLRRLSDGISIHALLTESDVFHGHSSFSPDISIHALLTESDANTVLHRTTRRDFNPRSPHGERQGLFRECSTVKRFQSTLSSRRATFQRRRV